MHPPTARQIRASHPDLYVAYHAPRYALALRELARAGIGPGAAVLDVGRSALTDLLAWAVGRADSLGLQPDETLPRGRHVRFDLNLAQRREDWRTDLGPYDAVVLGEVIEHLSTAPGRVLTYLRSLLRPGGVLLIQTPNAAALHKRLLLLLGRQPYHRLCEDRGGGLHVREYTMAEMRDYARAVGLGVERAIYANAFDYRFPFDPAVGRCVRRPRGVLVNAVYACVPPSWRRGMTLVLRHDGRAPQGRPGIVGL